MNPTAASYGLQQIILLDGHIPGVMTRLDVSAHATLIGTNGAGKTTLLKLLPLFYGLAPSALESRASGKKKFIDWYLPRPSSAIVFEYRRGDKLCCAVVYRHASGTKPAYRFLNSAFTEDAFSRPNLLEGRDYLLSKELGKHWRSIGLECSSQIEVVTEYRAILQRDRHLMSQSSRAKELRAMAARYGLGSGSMQMQHMEKVLQALVGRSGSMEKIRLMLAAIMRDEGVSVPKLPSHTHNERAIGDIGGLRQLKKEMPQLKKTVAANSELLAIEASLSGISAALRAERERRETALTALDEERSTVLQTLESLKADWQRQEDELNAALSRHKADVAAADSSINALDDQRSGYEAADMETWSEKWNGRAQIQAQRDDARSRYDGLLGQQSELEKKFDLRREKAKDNLSKELQRIGVRRNEVQQQRTELSEKFGARSSELADDFREKAEQLAERRNEQRETLVDARATRRAELQSTGYSDAESLSLKEQEASIDAAEREASQQWEKSEALNRKVAAEKQSLASAAQADDAARRQLAMRQSEYEALEQLCYPDDRSLLSTLRREQPEWVGTIGKVIDPKLLQRTDLSPETGVSENNASFYGLGLQLDNIAQPSFAENEEQLASRLQLADEQRSLARQSLEQAEKQRASIHKNLQALESEAELAAQKNKDASRKKAASRDAWREFKQRCDEALAARKQEAKQRLEQVEQQLKSLEASYESERGQLNERQRQAQSELKAARAGEQSLLDERDAEITAQEKAARYSGKETLKQIEADLAVALKEGGVDEKLLSAAKQALSAANLELNALLEREEAVNEYRSWQKSQWPRRPGLFEQLEAAQSLADSADSELKAGEQRYKEGRQNAKDRQLQIEQLLKQHREFIDSLQQATQRIAAFEPLAMQLAKAYRVTAVSERADSAEALLREAGSALVEREKLLATVQGGVARVEGIISRSGGTIADAWQEYCRDAEDQSGIAGDSADFWRLQPKVVGVLVDESIPTAERTLVDTMLAIGGQVDQFYGGLARVKSSIDSESRRISRSIEQALCVDVLEDIRVRLSSKVEELEYWGDLERFHRQWRAWQDEGGRDLPPESFTETLSMVLKMLKGSRITGDVESLFDLEITLTENGRNATVRNDRDLQEVSSTGLSFLALCSIFVGLTRLLCNHREIAIHWPLDELGTLAPENITRLFTMLSDNGIVILGGFPSNDLDLLKHFTHRYTIDRDRGLVEVTLEQDELAQMLNTEAAA